MTIQILKSLVTVAKEGKVNVKLCHEEAELGIKILHLSKVIYSKKLRRQESEDPPSVPVIFLIPSSNLF